MNRGRVDRLEHDGRLGRHMQALKIGHGHFKRAMAALLKVLSTEDKTLTVSVENMKK